MRLRTTPMAPRFDEYQFLTCLKYELWGARKRRFGRCQVGDLLAFRVGERLAGLARVSGKPFESEERVFDVYPARIPIRFVHATRPESRALEVAKILAYGGVGTILGPALAGYLAAHVSVSAPFFVSGLLLILASLVLLQLRISPRGV